MSLDGIDLIPLISRRADSQVERTLFWRAVSRTRNQRAVRRGDWKLMIDAGDVMLFHVKNDPFERNDQAARQPQRARELGALLEAWETDVDAEAQKMAAAAKRNLFP